MVDISHRDTAGQDPETLDLSALIQLVHDSQTRAIVAALKRISSTSGAATASGSLLDVLKHLDAAVFDEDGVDGVVPKDRIDGFLARPRVIEVGLTINRLVCIDFLWPFAYIY